MLQTGFVRSWETLPLSIIVNSLANGGKIKSQDHATRGHVAWFRKEEYVNLYPKTITIMRWNATHQACRKG